MRGTRAVERLFAAVVVAAAVAGCAATLPPNPAPIHVVRSPADYLTLVEHNPSRRLVDLAAFIPAIRLDIRYATDDNFMHRRLYPSARAWLRLPAAHALRAVQEDLEREGLGLKVFDGYRPYRVTVAMWDEIGDPRYVADPKEGSRHNRGAAVDVTLVDLRTGEELAMPTGYDDFTEKAHRDYSDLPPEVIENRERLRLVMERHGFIGLPTEWWHFDFRGWRMFELVDIPFDVLSELEAAGPSDQAA